MSLNDRILFKLEDMVNLAERNGFINRVGHENSNNSLKNILGELMPKSDFEQSYLKVIENVRIEWQRTGKVPQGNPVRQFIERDPTLPRRLSVQTGMVRKAFPISGVSGNNGYPVKQGALVVHSEVTLGETMYGRE